jgi:hypothetical protein
MGGGRFCGGDVKDDRERLRRDGTAACAKGKAWTHVRLR